MSVEVTIADRRVQVDSKNRPFLFLVVTSYQNGLWPQWMQHAQTVTAFWNYIEIAIQRGSVAMSLEPVRHRMTEEMLLEIIQQHATTMGLGEVHVSKTTVVGEHSPSPA